MCLYCAILNRLSGRYPKELGHGIWDNSVGQANVFQVYQNAIHFNLIQFCPPMPLFDFSVFLFGSSTVLCHFKLWYFLSLQDSEQVYGDFFHLVSQDLAMLFKRTYQLQKVSRVCIDSKLAQTSEPTELPRFLSRIILLCKARLLHEKLLFEVSQEIKVNSLNVYLQLKVHYPLFLTECSTSWNFKVYCNSIRLHVIHDLKLL